MTSINPINSVVNKRTSELNGIYRNRDEKRQAISAGQSGPNMVTGQQPMPRYLSNNNNSQGNFSMENKPPHQNQERYYNRNRQNQNWSRRQGNFYAIITEFVVVPTNKSGEEFLRVFKFLYIYFFSTQNQVPQIII